MYISFFRPKIDEIIRIQRVTYANNQQIQKYSNDIKKRFIDRTYSKLIIDIERHLNNINDNIFNKEYFKKATENRPNISIDEFREIFIRNENKCGILKPFIKRFIDIFGNEYGNFK